jgi:uncharacterized oligopeptide transporter (OPT) family protein
VASGLVIVAAPSLCKVYLGLKIGWGMNMSIAGAPLASGIGQVAQGVTGGRPFNILEPELHQTAAPRRRPSLAQAWSRQSMSTPCAPLLIGAGAMELPRREAPEWTERFGIVLCAGAMAGESIAGWWTRSGRRWQADRGAPLGQPARPQEDRRAPQRLARP